MSNRSLVIGYGALMNRAYVESLCGEGLLGFEVGVLRGYRRHFGLHYRNGCWDAGAFDLPDQNRFEGGVAYLDLRPASDTAFQISLVHVNGCGLAAIDASEYLYRRERVAPGDTLVDDAVSDFGHCPHYLYFGDPTTDPNGAYVGGNIAVNQSYVDRVLRGARELHPDGEQIFWQTTDPIQHPILPLVWRDF